jgi:hypothetical protein
MSDEIAGWIKENMRGKMNITHIRWNTDKPKFEDVKGKYIIVEYEDGAHSHLTFIETEKTYRDLIVNNPILSNFKKYSVVDFSDEPVYCEWVNRGTYWQGCGGQWSLVYKFCPHCGLPIKVIDELKPLQLMGIEPKVHTGMADDWVEIEWTATEGNSYFAHITEYYRIIRPTKREAIESWNSLVGKLTGEK